MILLYFLLSNLIGRWFHTAQVFAVSLAVIALASFFDSQEYLTDNFHVSFGSYNFVTPLERIVMTESEIRNLAEECSIPVVKVVGLKTWNFENSKPLLVPNDSSEASHEAVPVQQSDI